MNSNNKLRKGKNNSLILFIFLLLFFISISQVESIGVAPSSKELILSTSATSYTMRIFNDGGEEKTINIEISGGLKDFIYLERNIISFKEGETKKDILVSIKIPSDSKINPAEYVSIINFKDLSSGGQVSANVVVSSRLVVVIPGEGAYMSAKLFTPNFIEGAENSFSLEISNKGNEDIKNCIANIEIFSSARIKIDDIYSGNFDIPKGRVSRIPVAYTPQVSSGNYFAVAHIKCDGSTADAEHDFSIGSPMIRIIDLKSDYFSLNSVSEFDLIVQSDWGDEISNVYAKVILSKDSAVLGEFTTQTKNVPANGVENFKIYLNTRGLIPDEYDLTVKLVYLGKETIDLYSAQFSNNEARLQPMTGKVISGLESGEVEDSSLIWVLIVAIVIMLLAIIFLIKKLMQKNKPVKKK